ncbi:MAG: hypothetical protein MUE69_18200 [Myxococcota bacterium]|nr:hypothetical protein [Myxococcota bacterium]
MGEGLATDPQGSCPDGSFCGGAGLCDAECTWMGREMGCPGGQICGVDGLCAE